MYDNGLGVPKDPAQAARWYRKAADQGDATAQSNLAFMYAIGRGVPKDYVQAHMWSNLAAAGAPASGIYHDVAVKVRDHVAALMSPEQIAEAQNLAREWKPSRP
jgi:TPR repeat protein